VFAEDRCPVALTLDSTHSSLQVQLVFDARSLATRLVTPLNVEKWKEKQQSPNFMPVTAIQSKVKTVANLKCSFCIRRKTVPVLIRICGLV
jgi:hypothetical protein